MNQNDNNNNNRNIIEIWFILGLCQINMRIKIHLLHIIKDLESILCSAVSICQMSKQTIFILSVV